MNNFLHIYLVSTTVYDLMSMGLLFFIRDFCLGLPTQETLCRCILLYLNTYKYMYIYPIVLYHIILYYVSHIIPYYVISYLSKYIYPIILCHIYLNSYTLLCYIIPYLSKFIYPVFYVNVTSI